MRAALLVLVAALAGGCDKKPAESTAQTGRRTAAVKAKTKNLDPAGFCEKTWPAEGPEARTFAWPPTREVPGAQPEQRGEGWTWVNVWATWCKPCVEEFGLITRWKTALDKEGAGVRLALLSIDAPEDEAALKQRIERGLPGPTRWLRGKDDLGGFLMKSLGVGAETPIPIHAFVDPAGRLRCVRVGRIHDRDYGAVKRLVSR